MKIMKRVGVAIAILSLLTFPGIAGEEAEKAAWFDLEGCAICQNLAAEEGLMAHMEWEIHLLKNGMVSVGMVPEAFREKFERAGKNMQATGARMAQGEQLPLCGFCMSYGKLMMAGAQEEMIDTAAGYISITTSTDPDVIASIRAHGQRTIDEYETWKKSMEAGHPEHPEHAGHEGHGH